MKKRTLTLALNKTKIVNLSVTTKIIGGTGIESDINDPNTVCGIDTHMTDDKTNGNNSIPTVVTLVCLSILC
ncbi:hypothetical protein H2O64_17555 [Kordia sp. YSTF-M3]|uniref:Uncharacterized protein n=1 Tax=Kordia aestuariivivens TaxID=2759037 RepID=A0ABR7QDT9_9FLAO|nr:hypothetical protein [Kordia aestuariivivens]MBC8756484.1 hypothetical protein [Kordia aestuariivivens]